MVCGLHYIIYLAVVVNGGTVSIVPSVVGTEMVSTILTTVAR